jgi:hypothetical protein
LDTVVHTCYPKPCQEAEIGRIMVGGHPGQKKAGCSGIPVIPVKAGSINWEDHSPANINTM